MSHECPECKGKLVPEKDEVTCEDCGLVVEDAISRSFKRREKSTIMPTVIDGFGDEDWKTVPKSTERRLRRLKDLHEDIVDPDRKKFEYTLDKLKRFVGLDDHVYESAAGFYIDYTKNVRGGYPKNGIYATSLFLAAQKDGTLIDVNKVLEVFDFDKRSLFRSLKKMKRELKPDILSPSAENYIPKYCSELECNNKIINKANEILSEFSEKKLDSGRNPRGVAVSAIYVANMLVGKYSMGLSQEKLAKISGVSTVSIRNTYQKMIKKLDLEK